MGPHNYRRDRIVPVKASTLRPAAPGVLRSAEPCTHGWCWMCGDITRRPAVVSVITLRSQDNSRMRLCQSHWEALQRELGERVEGPRSE